MSNRTLIVRLEGGIGNQLFQLAAGKSIIPTNLVVDTSLLAGSIRNLEIESMSEYLDFGINGQGLSKCEILTLKKIYEKEQFSWVDLKSNFKRNSLLRGYFQHPKYADVIASDLAGFVRSKSDSEQISICKCPRKHIAVHIRRGDYLSNPTNKKIFGVLSDEYFEGNIRAYENNTHFILFSDSEISLKVVESASQVGLATNAEKRIKPIELLKALSSYDGLIMSNSSLSWWAARIGREINKDFEVMAPSSWFREIPKSSSLILETWKLTPPVWIE